MTSFICPFKSKSYSFKEFKVERVFKNETRNFNVFFKGEYIGYFDTWKPLTTYNNGREMYFLILEPTRSTLQVGWDKIGTIAFSCMNEKFVWKIKYVKLKEMPQVFVETRKVLIEKCSQH